MKAAKAVETAMPRAGGDNLVPKLTCKPFEKGMGVQGLFDMFHNEIAPVVARNYCNTLDGALSNAFIDCSTVNEEDLKSRSETQTTSRGDHQTPAS